MSKAINATVHFDDWFRKCILFDIDINSGRIMFATDDDALVDFIDDVPHEFCITYGDVSIAVSKCVVKYAGWYIPTYDLSPEHYIYIAEWKNDGDESPDKCPYEDYGDDSVRRITGPRLKA
jgi:hypothetical protein